MKVVLIPFISRTMASNLLIQLVISFFAGGSFITLLSLLAERSNEKVAGIIMMFPSTIVLGFFFLGLATSAEEVAAVIPATLIPLGLIIFSSVIYIYCSLFFSRYFTKKIPQVLVTFITSSLIWLIVASPFAIWKFTSFLIAMAGYFILILLAHYILNRPKFQEEISRPAYNRIHLVLRALITGSIIATVVLLGKVLDPFWGAVFTMFPAATFAALIIFHFYYKPSQLFFFMKKAPMGSFSLLIYTIGVMIFFPVHGIITGTIFSYVISLTFSLLLIKYQLKPSKIKI